MAVDGTKFLVSKPMEVRFYDVKTRKIPLCILEDLQSFSMEVGQETAYSTDGNGAYISADGHSKRMTCTGTAPYHESQLIALINGEEGVVRGAHQIRRKEKIKVEGGKAHTTKTPVGIAGAEIDYCIVLNTDNTYDRTRILQQSDTVESGKFKYEATVTDGVDTDKNVLTFHTDIEDGTYLEVAYNVTTDESSVKEQSKTNKFSKTVYVEMDGLCKDICSEEEYARQFHVFKAILNGTYTEATEATGDPATIEFSFEAMKGGCLEPNFWESIVYDDDEIQ